MDQRDINNRFAFHSASTEEKRNEHTSVRDHCRVLAGVLNERLPEGREKSLAITKLEEAMFWSNAAIARDPGWDDPMKLDPTLTGFPMQSPGLDDSQIDPTRTRSIAYGTQERTQR